MSITTSEMSVADFAAVCGNNRNNDGFGFGGDNAWWIIILLLFGWGGRGYGFGGGFGGNGGGGSCGCSPCATQADVRAAVDQQTLISKIDQQTYGMADSFTALNNTLNNNFRGIDNAICTLGYQNQAGVNALSAQLAQCCCDTRGAIKDVSIGVERAGWDISKQISDCCCDVEKMNLQSRFDAQMYNNNTLMAIDKLGDRIIDYMSNEKLQTLRDENQALVLQHHSPSRTHLLQQIRKHRQRNLSADLAEIAQFLLMLCQTLTAAISTMCSQLTTAVAVVSN